MQAADTARPVALITGSAKRIGAAIARTLHAAGYDVVLHYRHSAEAMHALCAELELVRPNSTLAVAADLADVSALPGVVEAGAAHFGRLDALVNNASAYYATPVATTSEAQWDELFAVNARAPYFLCQAAAPHLRESCGAIVNLADIYAQHPTAELSAYAASKAALISVTKSLALALAPLVRVNAVAPGAIAWPEHGPDARRKQSIVDRTPLARIGTMDEVCSAVAWLLSEANFTTGQILCVDGGRNISG